MSNSTLFRISFSHLDAVYEIYARSVRESNMFGFLEVEEFVFGETTSLVVDPSEERLKLEFNGVKRTYIPMHSVFRIDEVNKQGVAKVRDKHPEAAKISMFPAKKARLIKKDQLKKPVQPFKDLMPALNGFLFNSITLEHEKLQPLPQDVPPQLLFIKEAELPD